MQAVARIEQALAAALAQADGPACPPQLAAAMRFAVFPPGARLRPRLCLAVAAACGDQNPVLADAGAVAIELLHCASLVHDDLPCFDDADTRRGRPSVHKAYGQGLAVLTGDALIVLGFQTLARVPAQPGQLAALLQIIASSVGVPGGIVAGQAWECESEINLSHYHRAKTGALFAAATMAGAAAAGHDAGPWRALGAALGEGYQVADDIRDAFADSDEIGKPIGRDAALGRPNAIGELGVDGAVHRLEELIQGAISAIPPCAGVADLRALIQLEAKRLLPKRLSRHAA